MRSPAVALAALAMGVLVAGCGQDTSVESRLQEDTAAVVEAINAKDTEAARRALDTLDEDLLAAGRLGQLEASRIKALRAGVSTLRRDLALLEPKPSPTPAPTRPPAPVREDDKGGDQKDEEKDGEKDEDEGDGDGGKGERGGKGKDG